MPGEPIKPAARGPNKATRRQKLLFWFGAAMVALCIALSLAHGIILAPWFGRAHFALTWVTAALAMLALLAAELCDSISSIPGHAVSDEKRAVAEPPLEIEEREPACAASPDVTEHRTPALEGSAHSLHLTGSPRRRF